MVRARRHGGNRADDTTGAFRTPIVMANSYVLPEDPTTIEDPGYQGSSTRASPAPTSTPASPTTLSTPGQPPSSSHQWRQSRGLLTHYKREGTIPGRVTVEHGSLIAKGIDDRIRRREELRVREYALFSPFAADADRADVRHKDVAGIPSGGPSAKRSHAKVQRCFGPSEEIAAFNPDWEILPTP